MFCAVSTPYGTAWVRLRFGSVGGTGAVPGLASMASIVLTPTGVHFIQVAKWLGHSSYVLTLTMYADYIPEQETENPLPEPVAPANVDTGNVLNLHRSTAG